MKKNACTDHKVNDNDFEELKSIYYKLEHICFLLKNKGFEYSIRKYPRKQAGTGTFKFLQYHWARIYPLGYLIYCNGKFAFGSTVY